MGKGSVNKVILVGRLGADPDVRSTKDGGSVAAFNLATTESVKKDNEWVDQPEWHRVVAFGKTAENCGTYLSKGSQIYVEGSLRTRQWEDKDGVKRYTTEIVAREIQFLGGGSNGGNGGSGSSQSSGSKSQSGGKKSSGGWDDNPL